MRGDRAFRLVVTAAGIVVLMILAAITIFLIVEAVPALRADRANFLTERHWSPDENPPRFGIAALALGTLMTSVLALLIALPVSVGTALFLTQYAPRRVSVPLGYLVDLLAAVPSVVYGLWGLIVLVPHLIPLSAFLADHLGFIPVFASNQTYGRSVFAASLVLSVMVLPIIAAISREVFLTTPVEQVEAAYALGATRWEMIRTAVLPHGRPGLVSAAVLGLGRALGETIAVALVLSANFDISVHILTPGGNTIAANIANAFGDAGTIGRGALIASGLVLFAFTLVVNLLARAVIVRHRNTLGAPR